MQEERLTIVQYLGDYQEAYDRFVAGGKATYQAQRYSVGFVGGLAARLAVTVVCLRGPVATDAVLANGVRAICAGLPENFDFAQAVAAVAATSPDRLVVTTPIPPLFGWARAHQVRTIAMLADSFQIGGWRDRLRAWRLARRLRSDGVEWVGNHGLNACLSLLDIGVPRAKIVPWDWPPAFTPHDQPARERAAGALALAYVGTISEAKGVGDLIEAVALLRAQGQAVTATIYGNDASGAMAAKAAALGLGDAVRLPGPVANEDVPEAMRAADLVIVPSRHDYAEGLPLTIYEALASRTPIVASDHPMFRGALVDGESAAVFRAADPVDLARAIVALDGDPARYALLSRNGLTAWERLQLPVTWGDMLEHWLGDTAEDRRWLADHAVAGGRYDARLAERRRAMAGAQ